MQQSVDPSERRLTVEEFLSAYEGAEGRYELVDGEVVKMPAETATHVRIKTRILRQLDDAIRACGLPVEAFADGISLRVGPRSLREPDATVGADMAVDGDDMILERPLIAVEVVLPSSGRTDKVTKAVEYFRVPTLVHYLVVDPATRVITHHHRSGDDITLTEHTGGTVTLDPPGITVDIDALWQVIR